MKLGMRAQSTGNIDIHEASGPRRKVTNSFKSNLRVNPSMSGMSPGNNMMTNYQKENQRHR